MIILVAFDRSETEMFVLLVHETIVIFYCNVENYNLSINYKQTQIVTSIVVRYVTKYTIEN